MAEGGERIMMRRLLDTLANTYCAKCGWWTTGCGH
jgi:hypothetical protein